MVSEMLTTLFTLFSRPIYIACFNSHQNFLRLLQTGCRRASQTAVREIMGLICVEATFQA